MDRRTFLATTASTGAAMLLPAGSARADLPQRYAGTTLKVMLGAGGGSWEAYRQSSEEFAAKTGIRFDYTFLPDTNAYTKTVLDVTTGTNAFDGYVYTYPWKGELATYFADLEAIVPTIEGAPQLDLDDYPGDVIDAYGRVDGKLIGLPILGDATMMVWNRAQYEKAGLDPAAAPATWEEIVTNGKALEAAGLNGFGLPGGKGWQVSIMWIILFFKYGGNYFGPNYAPQFNSDAGRKAANFLVDQLQPMAPAGNLTWDFPEMLDGLMTGVSGQGMIWPGGFGAMLDPAKSAEAANLSFQPTPEASLLGGWAVGVNDASRNREAAVLWATYLASREVQKSAPAPARISVLSDPALIESRPHFPATLEALSGKLALFPNVPQSSQIVTYMYEELNAALGGEKSADAAMDDLQASVEDFVASLDIRQ
ncbi:ABC transporter substrate-binding protein [Tropicibacter sp. S64]|uniref:ABC transporter substrate-binding protein n=1 Tax=Tropicibacter sp. S64 TaxID=3415122 RepID=UPI003C7A0401